MMNDLLAPAKLFIGPKEKVYAETENMLRTHFCKEAATGNFACFCPTCRKIQQRIHSHIVWIGPRNGYTAQDIEIVFEKTRFMLEDDEHFFFVLQQAETLGSHSANRLLKVVEEPPRGYHFIFLSSSRHEVLPTIASRCQITMYTEHETILLHPILLFLLEGKTDPIEFESLIKTHGLNDQESLELSHHFLAHVTEQLIAGYKQGITNEHLEHIRRHLVAALEYPPQSGSSGLFWRNLALGLR